MYNVLSIDIDWIGSYQHLEKLNRLFFSKVDSAKRILFGKHHHQILADLLDHDNINLHNIDHHHDICDKDWQVMNIKNGKATHGSWVGNLMYENKIKEYIWFNNLDSEPLLISHFGSELILQHNIKYIADDHLEISEEIEYDLIFVALSPEYLIDHFGPCKTWLGIYQTYFDYCDCLYNDKTSKLKLCPDLANAPLFVDEVEKKVLPKLKDGYYTT